MAKKSKNKPAPLTAKPAPPTITPPPTITAKGDSTTMTQTEKVKPTPAKNGTTPAKADTAQASNEATETPEAKKRGVVPTMPAAILYKHGGRVHAAIHHPVDGTAYIETGKGVGSAKGALEDSGFRLSGESLDGPEWLTEKLPEGAELIGFCTIKGFPLPTK